MAARPHAVELPSELPDRSPYILGACDQRVTIYIHDLVWVRIHAIWVRVYRAPFAQYADAFHIEFKPKGKRRIHQLVEGYKPSIIVLAGWNHPDTRPSLIQRDPREATLTLSSDSVTIGRTKHTDMDVIIDEYILSVPPADVLLDLRGQTVATGRRWEK